MKKYLSGLLTGVLITSLAISALAISGRMTIEVDPINIQVNGQVFQPTDANGNPVDVFAYNGTTYAPLRALAEAYGLEVGYDAANNMATVTDPNVPPATPDTTASATDYSDWSAEDEAAYQEFKGLWEVSIFNDGYITLGVDEFGESGQLLDSILKEKPIEMVEMFCLRFDDELHGQYSLEKITYHFALYGAWGWLDQLENDKWNCGYDRFHHNNME